MESTSNGEAKRLPNRDIKTAALLVSLGNYLFRNAEARTLARQAEIQKGQAIEEGRIKIYALSFNYKSLPPFIGSGPPVLLSSSLIVIEVPIRFLIIMELRTKELYIGNQYREAQVKRAKDSKAQVPRPHFTSVPTTTACRASWC